MNGENPNTVVSHMGNTSGHRNAYQMIPVTDYNSGKSAPQLGELKMYAELYRNEDIEVVDKKPHDNKLNDPNGLEQVTDATSGNLYSVPVGRRWQSTQIDAASAGLTVDLMNETMLEVERKSGKTPNLIVCSYTQFQKLLNLSEDRIGPPSEQLLGKLRGNTVKAEIANTVVTLLGNAAKNRNAYSLNLQSVEYKAGTSLRHPTRVKMYAELAGNETVRNRG